LHELAKIKYGEAWANNYFLHTVHIDGRYFDPIVDLVIKTNLGKSPLQLKENNHIVIHRSPTVVEIDTDGRLLERDTRNLNRNALMKVYNKQDLKAKVVEVDKKNKRYDDLYKSSYKPGKKNAEKDRIEKLQFEQSKSFKLNQIDKSAIDIHKEILEANDS
jgi:hypothetical protein